MLALAKGRRLGLKPYPDGLKWLAANGYKAVLHRARRERKTRAIAS
jgi:hypothetical protein